MTYLLASFTETEYASPRPAPNPAPLPPEEVLARLSQECPSSGEYSADAF